MRRGTLEQGVQLATWPAWWHIFMEPPLPKLYLLAAEVPSLVPFCACQRAGVAFCAPYKDEKDNGGLKTMEQA